MIFFIILYYIILYYIILYYIILYYITLYYIILYYTILCVIVDTFSHALPIAFRQREPRHAGAGGARRPRGAEAPSLGGGAATRQAGFRKRR